MKASGQDSNGSHEQGNSSSPSDPSSPSNETSSADLSSSEASLEVRGHDCLKNTRCLKKGDHCLKDRPCLKGSACLKSQSSTDASDSSDTGVVSNACLKSWKCEKDPREAQSAGPQDSAESSASIDTASSSGTEFEQGTSDPEIFEKHTAAGPSTQTAPAHERDTWTLSHDYALKCLKESGNSLSWSEIATALGRTKRDVRERWDWIQAFLAAAKEKKRLNEANTPKPEISQIETIQNNNTEIINDKGKWKARACSSPTFHENQIEARAETHTAHQGITKTIESSADQIALEAAVLSGDDASSELSTSDDSADTDGYYSEDEEAWRQDRYLQKTLRGELYSPHASIQSDETFGPRDCQVLAAAESKYHRSKWLEMQANFFNATGRMIPLDLIRAKCERVERERYLSSQPAMKAGKKVQEWIARVESEDGHRS